MPSHHPPDDAAPGLVPDADSPAGAERAAIDRADYLVFSRTWAAAGRMSGIPRPELQRRLVSYFRRLCRRIDPTLTLEIGAHEASFSRWAAQELPAARVVALEANPYVHEKYADDLAGTPVEYHHLAAGPVNGDVQLNLPTEVMGRKRVLANRMASLGVHKETGDHIQVTVPGVRVDDFVELGDDDRVVAWVDVEGATGTVLEASVGILDRIHAMYVEVEREMAWVGQWLDADVAVFLRDHGLVPVARDLARHFQYNVVFARAELALQPPTTRQAATILRPR